MNNKVKLDELLLGITDTYPLDCQVKRLRLSSNEVKKGDLFFAIIGKEKDGREFIPQAIAKGASAVLYDNNNFTPSLTTEIPLLGINNLSEKISKVAANYYQTNTLPGKVIGVTGTNGKSSITHLLAQAITLLKKQCAIFGTLGSGFIDNLKPANLTTADPISLQKNLAQYKQADFYALEVSSHALTQHRVKALKFQQAIFTNLTHEHLDYHGTLEDYFKAKLKLFTEYNIETAIVNVDTEYGLKIIEQCDAANIVSYSLGLNKNLTDNYFYADDIKYTEEGASFTLHSSQAQKVKVTTKLSCDYNISNLLAVIASLHNLGFAVKDIVKVIPFLVAPPGRLNKIIKAGKPKVFIDFAHTPDAIEAVLKNLKSQYLDKKLWVVFGCGGDRDKLKRPKMAEVVRKYADNIVVTDDNPRFENPHQIFSDIAAGFIHMKNCVFLHNREHAIAYAINNSNCDDIIAVLGKGHETGQKIKDKVLPFDDLTVATHLLDKKR